jgi:protein TonB
MKNLKKQPTKQLEKFSNIFMQLGLVLVLFVVFVSLEHKTEERTLAEHTFIY